MVKREKRKKRTCSKVPPQINIWSSSIYQIQHRNHWLKIAFLIDCKPSRLGTKSHLPFLLQHLGNSLFSINICVFQQVITLSPGFRVFLFPSYYIEIHWNQRSKTKRLWSQDEVREGLKSTLLFLRPVGVATSPRSLGQRWELRQKWIRYWIKRQQLNNLKGRV